MTLPTPQDIRNAEARRTIADRQAAEYAEATQLATEALGPGWLPWMRLSLLESDYHRRQSPPAAVAYKVYRGSKTSENAAYVRRMPDGTVRHDTSYEPLFGDLLHEPDPERTIEVRGEQVHPARFCLCWAAVELYEPRSAEALAKARVKREAKAVEKEAVRNPLFADIIRAEAKRDR